jgi:apolipoprotein N-acyltransferase
MVTMRRPKTTWLAWSPLRLTVGVVIFAIAVGIGASRSFSPMGVTVPLWGIILMSLLAIAFSAAGALIATRNARNLVAWLLMGIGLTTGLTLAEMSYVETSLPGERWACGPPNGCPSVRWY